jgi:hypothetical protein
MALAEFEQGSGFDGAFEVEMEFSFRKREDERLGGGAVHGTSKAKSQQK